MKEVRLVICDLFLPKELAGGVCADLRLPALEAMLARGAATESGPSTKPLAPSAVEGSERPEGGTSLEELLCGLFGVPVPGDAPVAPIFALFDGLGEGCWLCADPVHLRLQRDQLILLPEVGVNVDEAAQLCAALNEHFAGQGMTFFAPHPQRWYMRLDRLPDIATVPLSQAAGRNVRDLLPKGAEAAHWHRVFNEIQMLLHSHPANGAREARGELTINSLWLWGGGCDRGVPQQKACDCVISDEPIAEMFAAAAGIPFSGWSAHWESSLTLALEEQLAIRLGGQNTAAKSLVISRGEREFYSGGRQLLVWTGLRTALRRGDLGGWRAALQGFEGGYAQPLWRALRAGKIAHLKIDILGGESAWHLSLTRTAAWAFWRRSRPLAAYAMV